MRVVCATAPALPPAMPAPRPLDRQARPCRLWAGGHGCQQAVFGFGSLSALKTGIVYPYPLHKEIVKTSN